MISRPPVTSLAPSAEFIPFIQAVGRGEKLKRDLTYDEATHAMRLILQGVNGGASAAQIGAFLVAQRVKGEGAEELRAFVDVVRREFMQPVVSNVDGVLDLATPYDGKAKTLQLAPAIALIVSAAGVPVLLHGAQQVPTKFGVTVGQVLAALGVPVDFGPHHAGAMLSNSGIAYIDAANFAPAWQRLTALRAQFGLRTVCNTIEKWFNPANADYQISGFFHANYIERVRSGQTGVLRSFIVQGEEGSIEMAVGRRTPVTAVTADEDRILDPATIGFSGARVRLSVAPAVAKHAMLNRQVIAGEDGPALDQAALTAGSILYLLQAESDWQLALARAYDLIRSGSAERQLWRAQEWRP